MNQQTMGIAVMGVGVVIIGTIVALARTRTGSSQVGRADGTNQDSALGTYDGVHGLNSTSDSPADSSPSHDDGGNGDSGFDSGDSGGGDGGGGGGGSD